MIALLVAGALGAEPTADAEVETEAAEDEDGGWAGLAAPLISYDSNLLLGLGAFGQIVRGDTTGERPYAWTLQLQLYGSTGGYQDHFLLWDLPAIAGSKLRWGGRARFTKWTRARYVGLGQFSALPEDPNAILWNSTRPWIWNILRVGLGESDWEAYGSAFVLSQAVETYPNTILAAEQPTGVEGGWLPLLTAGLFHDTRDNEIHPTAGHTLDLAVYGAHGLWGSAWDYGGVHVAFRGFASAGDNLVVAGHALVEAAGAGEPFFQQAQLDGLSYGFTGGRYLLRGLTEERLRGNGVVATQLELRWTYARSEWFGWLELDWMVVPFADAGRVWTWDEPWPAPLAPTVTGGSGLRVNIEKLLILRADVGLASERYLEVPTRRLQPQVYVLGDHPF